MQNPIQRKTKEINGLQYTAYISNNEIKGITYKSPNFIGKITISKFHCSYSKTITTRFQNIAKHFEEA